MTMKHEYDKDFYAWAKHNAALIRQRKFAQIDIENIAEELESMGRSEKRELINRLSVLISHLLKWQFVPGLRTNSWRYLIKEQRLELSDLLQENSSLRYEIEDKLDKAYKKAHLSASRETGFGEKTFPEKCPFSLEECLNDEFFPLDPTPFDDLPDEEEVALLELSEGRLKRGEKIIPYDPDDKIWK